MQCHPALIDRILTHPFEDLKAAEFAHHGLARRINSMSHSINRVFEDLPPDFAGLPERNVLLEVTVHIQSVVIHTYGCFDNLAQIWVAERNVRRANGSEIPLGRIGFSGDKIDVIQSLPTDLKTAIEDLDPWLKFLEEFRHSTAHRKPLYIPPFMVDPKNEDKFKVLNEQATNALSVEDIDEYDRKIELRNSLCFFKPMHATSVPTGRTAFFHPQLIADFSTVEDWVKKVLDAVPNSVSG